MKMTLVSWCHDCRQDNAKVSPLLAIRIIDGKTHFQHFPWPLMDHTSEAITTNAIRGITTAEDPVAAAVHLNGSNNYIVQQREEDAEMALLWSTFGQDAAALAGDGASLAGDWAAVGGDMKRAVAKFEAAHPDIVAKAKQRDDT